MTKRFTKDDIEYHATTSNGYHPAPAVNVKVRGGGYFRDVPLPLSLGRMREANGPWVDMTTHPLFTHEWIEQHIDEADGQTAWEVAIANGWEYIKSEAERIFGSGTKVYSTGRSGGWAYVDEFRQDDVEGWDAIAVSRWASFVKSAEAAAADVPRQMVDFIYHNVFLPWLENQRTEVTEKLGDIAARERVAIYAGGAR